MVRAFKNIAILIFMTGLVYPYIHLSLHAHRFCPYHQAFEPINPEEQNSPTHNPVPGAPNHKKCPFAQMLSATTLNPAPTLEPVSNVDQHLEKTKTFIFHFKSTLNILMMAPKQSPPSTEA